MEFSNPFVILNLFQNLLFTTSSHVKQIKTMPTMRKILKQVQDDKIFSHAAVSASGLRREENASRFLVAVRGETATGRKNFLILQTF